MEKSNKNKIVIGIAALLIAGIVAAAALLVSGQLKEKKYYEQLREARAYMISLDYDRGIEAYKAAIEINPEEADAYIELAEIYIDIGDYTEAAYTAELGSLKSGSESFQALMAKLDEIRDRGEVVAIGIDDIQEGALSDEIIYDNVSVRYGTIENVADFCYQEYVNEYGSATMNKVSDEEGYRAKFQGFGGYAYFKNTAENKNAVDEATRRPAKSAKPYKVVITSTSLLFVGYNGSVSNARLGQMFNTSLTSVYDEVQKAYFVEFEYMGCRIRLEVDERGNMGTDPVIELYPLNLIKEDWVEEETEETEEEIETFTLGSHTYTYDVTSIVIIGENIGDISPLADCKNLRELVLESCTINGLEPLAKCSSLEILDLRRSRGFSDLSPLSGLSNLLYLDLHGCSAVSDISPIMGLNLRLLHTCDTGVTREQTQAYKDAHPDCEVWYDNHTI